MLYRVANNVGPTVSDWIQPGYEIYTLMVPLSFHSWTPVAPNLDDLSNQEWYSPFKFVDPNTINERMGLPPNYVILKIEDGALKKWVEENFFVERWDKESESDILFEGTYKGPSQEETNENKEVLS